MEYKPLVQMNPTMDNITIDSSIWLCSRMMPGKGNEKISFPHYRIVNKTGVRICDTSDTIGNGLIAMNDNEEIIDVENQANNLNYIGLWTIDNNPVIGCGSDKGLICPMNTFNVGYRYKNGWRPSKI